MKSVRTTSYSSTSKVKSFSVLATCDEEPDVNNKKSSLRSSPSIKAVKDCGNATVADKSTSSQPQKKTASGLVERKIIRNKTKSHENYGSLEEASKSFEDQVVSR